MRTTSTRAAPPPARRARAARPSVGDDEALVGNIVADRYRIGDVIGVGTTGTVFATEHLTFAWPAAMKVLRPRFADADLVSRVFHGEARAAWSVSHPCLCEVFDIGTLPDGAPFLMMERLEGETLANRIGRERMSLAAAVDVMMQLLSAVLRIHTRDLPLRDLRPQNVYLAHRRGCRPVVKIFDFGLARLTPLERVQEEWDALQATAFGDEIGGVRDDEDIDDTETETSRIAAGQLLQTDPLQTPAAPFYVTPPPVKPPPRRR